MFLTVNTDKRPPYLKRKEDEHPFLIYNENLKLYISLRFKGGNKLLCPKVHHNRVGIGFSQDRLYDQTERRVDLYTEGAYADLPVQPKYHGDFYRFITVDYSNVYRIEFVTQETLSEPVVLVGLVKFETYFV